MATASTLDRLLTQLRRTGAAGRFDDESDSELLERFRKHDDPASFEALVRRHGPLVLAACRKVLSNGADVDDAFQVTFLILLKNARTIRDQRSVGSWLYGVAHRVAVQARAAAARRQRLEQRAGRLDPAPAPDLSWRDACAAVHEELDRLPEQYRLPLLLCYLEGMSRDEAARRLGWTLNAVRGRLERGRNLLRGRLARRGLALSAGLLGALGDSAAASGLPPKLLQVTLQAATAGRYPPAVAALLRGVTPTMFTIPLKLTAVLALAAGLIVGGVVAHAAAQSRRAGGVSPLSLVPQGAHGRSPVDPTREEAPVTHSGRVLDPDSKPVAGARLYLPGGDDKGRSSPKVRATTDEQGRFRISGGTGASLLIAAAEGYGLTWVSDLRKPTDLTLRLAKDDVPVTGRILDLQGKPVAGATILVNAVKAPVKGILDAWLEAVKVRKDGIPIEYEHLSIALGRDIGHLFPKGTTDKDGRFRLAGVGRERVVALVVQGPTLQTMEINAVTRPGVAPFTKPYYESGWRDQLIYYGASFDHPTPPCRPVTGVVRDRATGKPLSAAVVRDEAGVGNPRHYPQATADGEGRYRLTGIGKGEGQGQTILALSPEDQPYLTTKKNASGGTGLGPISLDFELTKGVWLEGRVTDKVTKRAIEAVVGYFVFESALEEGESKSLHLPFFGDNRTDRHGKFRLVAHPGRGLVGVRAVGAAGERYCPGVGAEAIKGSVPSGFPGLTWFLTFPRRALPRDFDGLKEVNPAAGDETVTCDVVLDPGRPLTVRVEGPDGKPLAGARVLGQLARELWSDEPVQAEFPVHGFKPGDSRTLLFRHEGKGLAGLLKIKGDERGPLTARLAPAAAVSGRLLDDEGRPLRHAEISIHFLLEERPGWVSSHHPSKVYTDAAGKFRIDGMAPAVKYSAMARVPGRRSPSSVFPSLLALPSGEKKDLGDVRVKPAQE